MPETPERDRDLTSYRLHPADLADVRRRILAQHESRESWAWLDVSEAVGLLAEIDHLEACVDEQQERVAELRGRLWRRIGAGLFARVRPFFPPGPGRLLIDPRVDLNKFRLGGIAHHSAEDQRVD